MATIFNLLDATPYELLYLMTSDGETGNTVLPNAALASPDLRTNSNSARASSGATSGLPLFQALSTPFAVGVNVNEVRRLMLGGAAAIVAAVNLIRVTVTPARGASGLLGLWSVDCNEGTGAGNAPSTGFGVYIVRNIAQGAGGAATAYLRIKLMHTMFWRGSVLR